MPGRGFSAAVVSLGKKLVLIAWATQLLNQDNIGVCAQGGAEKQLSGYSMPKKVLLAFHDYQVINEESINEAVSSTDTYCMLHKT